MIKAALITPNLSMGGAERWIVSLIKHSDPARLQWTGVALSGWGGCDPELCEELVAHTRIVSGPPRAVVEADAIPGKLPPALFKPKTDHVTEVAGFPLAVREVVKDADVVVTWGGAKFDRSVNRPDIPLVLVSHSSHTKPTALTLKQGISHLVAVSEAATRPLIHPGNPPPTIIHNGAELRRLHPVMGRDFIRDEWQIPPGKYVVGYVGRFSQEKNPCAAIEAVRLLGDEWAAVYYGELPGRQHAPDPDLIAPIQTFGDPQVRVYPHTPYVGDIYAGIDVLMLASHTEAFSMTMIEAWLTGVPIVATPVGAVEELEARYGPLVTRVPLNPTPQQLAAACEQAVSPDGLAIAEKALAIALEHWTAEAMALRWMDYLEGVIRTFQPPAPVAVPAPSPQPSPRPSPVMDLDL